MLALLSALSLITLFAWQRFGARQSQAWVVPIRARGQAGVCALAAGLLLTLGMTGCGGGSGGRINPAPDPGTPAGTYTLTVTGTTNSGSSTLSHNATLSLIVT